MAAPRKYTDVTVISNMCDEYFASVTPTEENPNTDPPTVNGLALFLGFGSKSTVYEYRDRNDELSYPIKRALTRIEMQHEIGLYGRNATGHIFALKNSGWKDSQDINVNAGSVDLSAWVDSEK